MPNNLLRFHRRIFIAMFCVCTSIVTTYTRCLCEDDNSKVNENLKKILEHRNSQPVDKGEPDRGDLTEQGLFTSVFSRLGMDPLLGDGEVNIIPFYAGVPLFRSVEGHIIDAPDGKRLTFSIVVEFAGSRFVIANRDGEISQLPDEYTPELVNAAVLISADRGETWREISMLRKDRWDKRGSFRESWIVDVPFSDISTNGVEPILYLFKARSNSGGVAMELPVTQPGWPPDTTQYFPSVHTATSTLEINPPTDFFNLFSTLKTIDAFTAFDGNYLYVAFRTRGGIPPFLTDQTDMGNDIDAGIIPLIYAIKYADITREQTDGYPVGKWQLYAPLLGGIVNPFEIFELNNKISRLFDGCPSRTSPMSTGLINIGISNRGLFTRVPLTEICSGECESLRIVIGVMDYASILYPPDQAFLPSFNIYFRSHSIGEQIVEAKNGTAIGLEPPTQFAPEPGRSFVEDWTLWPENAPNIESMKTAYTQFGYGASQTFQGTGPFRVKPCDTVIYGNYRFEVYSRNENLKVRIYEGSNLIHTIMIGPGTKPSRDEQHKIRAGFVRLSNFSFSPLSCNFEIVK